MDKHVNSISNRLSLRTPQRDSLEILARIAEIIPLDKEPDLQRDLEIIQSEFETVEDFERNFPSLCFALATGVGKTRLMGAFIAYLHLSKGVRHFMVLAPNLTIYNKLIADFTPNTPKYVFQGISEFAMSPPEIITGDNYESKGQLLDWAHNVHINIFNISKINTAEGRKIRELSEYLGESYFEYLAGLDDLVLLMDEAHRYRASAGLKAIDDLQPTIGLELTATPQLEKGQKTIPFKNTIYGYPLFKAMEDGYVKEPAVATRENFNPSSYTEEQLEQLKLEDGIRIHETVKTELKVYADNNDKPLVKPFMLVVAKDTDHANELVQYMESKEFYKGRYKGHVITVHSSQKGDEKDETVERLLAVENPEEPTEIVVHVNMLKEGWDVTNLYTIVPLRAANSRTLVEQSIGRGLRLPYGTKTGVAAVDRLTIVAHDKFDDIIQEANNKESIIRTGIVIGKDIEMTPKKAVEVRSSIEALVVGQPEEIDSSKSSTVPKKAANKQQPLFNSEKEKEVAQTTLEVIKEFEKLPSSKKLKEKDIRKQIEERVEEVLTPVEPELEGISEKVDIAQIVEKVTEAYIENTIDIPRIVLTPKGDGSFTYDDFDLDTSGIGRPAPIEQELYIQELRTHERERIEGGSVVIKENRLEDHLISALIDYDDISYDEHADLLYKLSGQMVDYVRLYLNDEEEIRNVLVSHRKQLSKIIHAQMLNHYNQGYTEFEASVPRGFEQPKRSSMSMDAEEKARYYRDQIQDRTAIRGMLFQGFGKCIYEVQKFDSDSERLFSVLLEDDDSVVKWFKPTRDDFKIFYHHQHQERLYEPDFVVETKDAKLICEPKRADAVDSDEVQEKAKAAIEWCEHASKHELDNDGKPWQYVLIPHDEIKPSATLAGLIAKFSQKKAA